MKEISVWTDKVKTEAYLEPRRASMMEFYCENSCQLTATLSKSPIIDIRMGSNYAFQTIELVKMEVRLRKSSRTLQCTAFLFLPCFGIIVAHCRKWKEPVFGYNKRFTTQNFKTLKKNAVTEFNETKVI